jgi:hypothetical protein
MIFPKLIIGSLGLILAYANKNSEIINKMPEIFIIMLISFII